MSKTIEELAAEKATPAHVLAGAKTFNRWGQGHMLTPEAFDAGIEAYSSIPMGGDPLAPPANTAGVSSDADDSRAVVFNDFAKKSKKSDL